MLISVNQMSIQKLVDTMVMCFWLNIRLYIRSRAINMGLLGHARYMLAMMANFKPRGT